MSRPLVKGLPIRDVVPNLADELKELLKGEGEDGIAAQVDSLRILSRCNCTDDFCATFRTRLGRYAESVPLDDAKDGIIVVDIDTRGRVLSVEVLYRDEYKAVLDRVMPLKRRATKTT